MTSIKTYAEIVEESKNKETNKNNSIEINTIDIKKKTIIEIIEDIIKKNFPFHYWKKENQYNFLELKKQNQDIKFYQIQLINQKDIQCQKIQIDFKRICDPKKQFFSLYEIHLYLAKQFPSKEILCDQSYPQLTMNPIETWFYFMNEKKQKQYILYIYWNIK